MDKNPEISRYVISINEMIDSLNSILPDSFILRMDYRIAALGSELESLIEFSSDEMEGVSFSTICQDRDFREILEEKLSSGYFVDQPGALLTKSGKIVEVSISGFYLGLISDINGYIILKTRLAEDNTRLRKELISKKQELDSFIYRTAHDLRGPLATIKGLVNLLKIRKSNREVDALNELIEIHANKLDDRLFKLLYLADTSFTQEAVTGSICFSVLKGALKKTLEDNCQLDKAIFLFTSPGQDVYGVDERHVERLISNVFLYIISLPILSVTKPDEVVIGIDFKIVDDWLSVRIDAHGFMASEKIRDAISKPTSIYNDLLSYPSLFNYYVAQKEALHMHALFKVEVIREKEQVLRISIPLHREFSNVRRPIDYETQRQFI